MQGPIDKFGVILAAYMRDEVGGGYFVVTRLANYFQKTAHRIAPVVLMNDRDGFVQEFLNPEVMWEPLDLPKAISSVQRRALSAPKLLQAAFSVLTFYPGLGSRVLRICREQDIRLFHIHSHTALLLLAPIARLARARIVYHFHDSFLPIANGGTLDPVTKRILRVAMRHLADRIIVISDSVRQSIIQEESRVTGKIHVVLNGIDVAEVRQSEIKRYTGGRPQVISYGVLAERKGFQTVIQAIAILRRDHGLGIPYRILGEGPFRTGLASLARDLGVADLVEIAGFQKRALRSVAQSDIVIVPSVYAEPFGLVVIESMANSKIIIAARSGAIPEMLCDGVQGFLVEPNDPSAIAQKILEIMDNPDRANALADDAFRRCRQDFTIERMAAEVETVYREVLNRTVAQMEPAGSCG